jgi:hypothetical protein
MKADPTAEQLLRSHFGPLGSLPCWLVKQGYASCITMEFGEPRLEIREPRPGAKHKLFHRRLVTVRGEHHLWINQCEWTITEAGQELAHSESDDKTISRALLQIDGQLLETLEISPTDGECELTFEQQMLIRLKRYEYEDADPSPHLWTLFAPEIVIGLRADGQLDYGPGDGTDLQSVECGEIRLLLKLH